MRPRPADGRRRSLPGAVRPRTRDRRRGRRGRTGGDGVASGDRVWSLSRSPAGPVSPAAIAASVPAIASVRPPAARSGSARPAGATAVAWPTCSWCRPPTTCSSRLPAGTPRRVLCTLVDNVVDGYRTVARSSPPPGVPRCSWWAGPHPRSGSMRSPRRWRWARAGPLRRSRRGGCVAAATRRRGDLHEGPWPRSFERAPVTVENTMDTEGLACTLRSTDDYGFCTAVAIHFGASTPVPLLHMYTRGSRSTSHAPIRAGSCRR